MIEKSGGSAQLVICDITDESTVHAAVRTAAGDEGHLDVAVNSAGCDGEVAAPTADWTGDMLDEMLSSNVRGTFLSMKYELAQMRDQGFGAIVNVGSDAGLLGVHSGYVASKHAGIGLTRSAALEYAAEGIRVNAVRPALVDTPLIHDSDGNLFDYIKPLIAAHPLGRIAQAAEIADAIVWMCSDKSSYVTGSHCRSTADIPPNSKALPPQRKEHTMSTIHFHQTTTSTPSISSPGSPTSDRAARKLFPNSADAVLKVYHRGRREADVTEGSGGVWERLYYDWSDPNHVKLTTTDSNMFGGASGYTYTYTYTFRRQPNGTTDVDVVIVREGKNLKGRVLADALGSVGKRSLGEAFANSVKAVEAAATPAQRSERVIVKRQDGPYHRCGNGHGCITCPAACRRGRTRRDHWFPMQQHSLWSFWCSPSSAALRSSRPAAKPAGAWCCSRSYRC